MTEPVETVPDHHHVVFEKELVGGLAYKHTPGFWITS